MRKYILIFTLLSPAAAQEPDIEAFLYAANLESFVYSHERVLRKEGSALDMAEERLFSGYIWGVADYLRHKSVICIGDNVYDQERVLQVVLDKVNKTIPSIDQTAAEFVAATLQSALPCK